MLPILDYGDEKCPEDSPATIGVHPCLNKMEDHDAITSSVSGLLRSDFGSTHLAPFRYIGRF